MFKPAFDRPLRMAAFIVLLGVMATLFQLWRELEAGREDMRKLMARIDAIEAGRLAIPGHAGGLDIDAGTAVVPGQPGPASAVAREASASSSAAQSDKDELARRRELDARFAGQAPSRANDATPQQVIATFNSDALLGAMDVPSHQDVICRSEMCLIEASFPPGADGSDWATRLMLELGGVLPSYSTVNVPTPDGGFSLRVYAIRSVRNR